MNQIQFFKYISSSFLATLTLIGFVSCSTPNPNQSHSAVSAPIIDSNNEFQNKLGALSGIVRFKGEKEPLINVTIIVDNLASLTTGETGEYQFSNLFPGEYSFRATKNGQILYEGTVQIYKGKQNKDVVIVASSENKDLFPPTTSNIEDSKVETENTDEGTNNIEG